MKILYDADAEFVVVIDSQLESKSVVRVAEVLIETFEDECDVSFLRWVLVEAKKQLQHSVQ